MSNPDRHSASLSVPKHEVLSESTTLDSLMVAIVGDERQQVDDRVQIVAAINAQVAQIVQELGLEQSLTARRRRESLARRRQHASVTEPQPRQGEAAIAETRSPREEVQGTDITVSTEAAPATSATQVECIRPGESANGSSKLRQTLGKLFRSRTSMRLVLTIAIGVALVSVSAIGERSAAVDVSAVISHSRSDVALAAPPTRK